MARNYKKMEVYHLAYNFVLQLYKITNQFPNSEEHNIKSQIRRAAVSIPLNIAEGSAKSGLREFKHYLNTSYASAKEVEVLLQLSRDLNFFSNEDFCLLGKMLDEVNAKLYLFLRNLESRSPNNKAQFFQKFENNISV